MTDFTSAANANSIALVALITSLFALVVAAIQLAVSWFNVDGLRQCSRAAIGGWSVFRKRVFRTEDLRFEISYTVPHLFLGTPDGSDSSQTLRRHGKAYSTLYCLALHKNEKQARQSLLEILTDCRNSREKGTSNSIPLNCLSHAHSCENVQPVPRIFSSKRDSWMGLIEAICGHWSESVLDFDSDYLYPMIQLETRSWDTMVGEISRPVASTTISALGVIVRSMGMMWKKFEPYEEQGLVAEGGGYYLASTLIKGLGILVQFRTSRQNDRFIDPDESRRVKEHPLYPDRTKDLVATYSAIDQAHMMRQSITLLGPRVYAMMYGIWPGDPSLDLPDFKISEWSDCLNIIERLCEKMPPGKYQTEMEAAITKVKKMRFINRSYQHYLGFPDLLNLVAPTMRRKGEISSPFPLLGKIGSHTYEKPEMNVFKEELGKLIRTFTSDAGIWPDATSHVSHLERIQTRLEEDCWPPSFNSWRNRASTRNARADSLDRIQELYDEETKCLKLIGVNAWDLIETHMSLAPIADARARKEVKAGTNISINVFASGARRARVFTRAMEIYFEFARSQIYADLFRQKFGEELLPAKITVAWVMIYFRSICWRAVHGLNKYGGDFLPTKYINSNTRVYLD